MSHKPRPLEDNAFYHLIAKANNGMFILNRRSDYLTLIAILRKAKCRFDWKIHHYCIMSNHFHILAYMPRGKDLPALMTFILRAYSNYYRKKIEYQGHVWIGRYRSFLIKKESYLLECGRYIERNPIRAGMVDQLGKYPWSSYPHYALSTNDPLVDESPYYSELGKTPDKRKAGYEDFIKIDNPYEGLLTEMLEV